MLALQRLLTTHHYSCVNTGHKYVVQISANEIWGCQDILADFEYTTQLLVRGAGPL